MLRTKLRKILWQFLGVPYSKILRSIDFIYTRDAAGATFENGSFDNGSKLWSWNDAKLTIGKYCSIAPDVQFILDSIDHNASPITNYPILDRFFEPQEKHTVLEQQVSKHRTGIKVGHDVWIGHGAIVLPGVTIGNGVTIAAGAVVISDINDYTIVGGVPARIIKVKYNKEQIQKLNDIAWWDWEEGKIANARFDFLLPLDAFLQKHSPTN